MWCHAIFLEFGVTRFFQMNISALVNFLLFTIVFSQNLVSQDFLRILCQAIFPRFLPSIYLGFSVNEKLRWCSRLYKNPTINKTDFAKVSHHLDCRASKKCVGNNVLKSNIENRM